jgi:hypothetical protein
LLLIATLVVSGSTLRESTTARRLLAAELVAPQPNVWLNGPVFTFWFSETERITGLFRSVDKAAFLVELRGSGRVHRVPRERVLAISRQQDRVVREFDDFESADRAVFEPAVQPEWIVPSPAKPEPAASNRCLSLLHGRPLISTAPEAKTPVRLSFRIHNPGKSTRLMLHLAGHRNDASQPGGKKWEQRVELVVTPGGEGPGRGGWRTVIVDAGDDRVAVLLDASVVKLLQGEDHRLDRVELHLRGAEPLFIDDWCWDVAAPPSREPDVRGSGFLVRLRRHAPRRTGVITVSGLDFKQLALGRISPREVEWTDSSGTTQTTEWSRLSAVVLAAAADSGPQANPTATTDRAKAAMSQPVGSPSPGGRVIEFMPRFGDALSTPDQLRVTVLNKTSTQLTARHAVLGEVTIPMTDVQMILEQ